MTRTRSNSRSDAGFTLIELMIVIAIIGILSIIVVPRFMDIPQKARVDAAKQQIAAFGPEKIGSVGAQVGFVGEEGRAIGVNSDRGASAAMMRPMVRDSGVAIRLT